MPPELYKHQKEAVLKCLAGNMLLEHDCGTGKTATGLTVADYWIQREKRQALVVGIKSTLWSAWMEDAKTFTPHLKVVDVWHKNPTKRRALWDKQADVYVTNYETFKSSFDVIQAKKFGTVIIDESSKIKSNTSQNAHAALALAGFRFRKSKFHPLDPVPHRYCLSATPAPNKPYEYWTQMKFCAGPGRCFSDNYYSFRAQYFCDTSPPTETWTRWEVNKDMEHDFLARLTNYCDVVNKEDVLDLPEQVDLVRHVMLSPTETACYKEFKKEMVLQYGDQEIIAKNALAKIMKLRQMTSGFFYDEDHCAQVLGKSKLKEVDEILEELGDEQVIIWCQFKYEIRELYKALRTSGAVTLYNETKDQQASIQAFKSGAAKILIAHPQSAGHGLTFTNAAYNILFSQSYSWEFYKQLRDRIHRIGQTRTCFYFHLIAPGTVDEVLLKVVQRKGNLNAAIKEFLK